MNNPYKIEGPAVISFSGGRSSGFMLWNILQAHDHKLPDDIKVVFSNTGLEHHETYEFIHRIEENWCDITWLEYTLNDEKKPSHKVVNYDSASRNGEPFDLLIKYKKFLPNPVARICTVNLKIETLNWYIDWPEYHKCIGLRADEPRRVTNMRKKPDVFLPMADADHSRFDVMEFWAGHELDLNLPMRGNILSNCVGCYLKSYKSLEQIALSDPQYFSWWIETEEQTGSLFRSDRPAYAKIKSNAHKQMAFDFGDTIDCFCTD